MDANGMFACSPDGFVCEAGGVTSLLEIKSPFRAKDCPVWQVDLEYLDEEKLRESHKYYGQAQLGMQVTKTTKCYFFVYSSFGSKVIIVPRNEVYIDKLMKTLIPFYRDIYLPVICGEKELICTCKECCKTE